MNKKVFISILVLPLGIFMFNTHVVAMSGGTEVNLKDVITDTSGELYETTDTLLITSNDIQYLKKVNFSDFSDLHFISLRGVYIDDGSLLSLDKEIDYLSISDSVVNISTFDLNNYKTINIANSYNLGKKVENSKIDNIQFLNAEYHINQNYDDKITQAAMDIYISSDKTVSDIIKKVTLYVVENIEYDINGTYVNLPIAESIIDKKMGVCEHYAYLESQLLNKLGIFAVRTGGYVDKSNPSNSTHAWNLVYVDGEWYNLDPTWLDTETGYNDITNNNTNINYMSKIDDVQFNSSHFPFFTTFDSIPINTRVSKMSIIELLTSENNNKKEEENVQNDSENNTINPPTGISLNYILLTMIFTFPITILFFVNKKGKFFIK